VSSRRPPPPACADDVLDVIVRTMGREAQRIEERSKRRALKAKEIFLLAQLGTVVAKVADQINSPFSPTYQARLRRMTDEQLDTHKRRVAAIEGVIVDQ
jgi:hypothetical protein